MNINVNYKDLSSYSINNTNNSILIAGPAKNDFCSKEILQPKNKNEAYELYGSSDLYYAYCLLYDLNISSIHTVNCYNYSDYILIVDKLIHYNFNYFVPLTIFFRDKFYNKTLDKDIYYSLYVIEQLSKANSLTTVLMTDKHASLYEDFDHYIKEMSDIEYEFNSYCSNLSLIETSGNSLNFIYNNLIDIAYSNVMLAGLYITRDYAKYLNSLTGYNVVFDISNIDMFGLRAMYFKYNYYKNNITVENIWNFRKQSDIYSNALIDDVIKKVIKSINLDKYKGSLYNQYIAIQIESEIKKILENLRGKLFKNYKINKISFKRTEASAGYIIVDYSIVPYGTVEELNILMGI